jgi:hypothetical protein
LLEKGGRNGTVIRLLCPLIITQEECVEVVARFKKAVAEALKAVRGLIWLILQNIVKRYSAMMHNPLLTISQQWAKR